MRLYLLTRGTYSDYGVCALVQRAKPITNEEWDAAYRRADREYWSNLQVKRAEFIKRTGYEGPDSGPRFADEWMSSPEYKSCDLNNRYIRATKILKAKLVKYTETWCDV